jgi:hypothetical protein
MEPILFSLLRPLVAAGACQVFLTSLVADPQRLAIFAAWEAELAAGWQEPEPEQHELLELPLDPALVGSGWDSWSSNPWLDEQQVEELPGAWFC